MPLFAVSFIAESTVFLVAAAASAFLLSVKREAEKDKCNQAGGDDPVPEVHRNSPTRAARGFQVPLRSKQSDRQRCIDT